jgi:hypothetical protein
MFAAMKAGNVLLGVGIGAIVLYQLARARFIGDLQVRIAGAKIKSLYNIELLLQFINPSNVSVTVNSIYGNILFNGVSIAEFTRTAAFTIRPGISTSDLTARVDLPGLIRLGFASMSGIKTPLIVAVDGYAIAGALRVPIKQTIKLTA